MSKSAHQLINQTSGKFEYYTPQPILDAARKVLGEITLDPASSKAANAFVKANCFFTETDAPLHRPWFGNVWMNHPFGRTENPLWIGKLIHEFSSRRVGRALCITYACTSEAWFHPLMHFPQCFLVPRTNYILPDGSVKRGVTKGSVVTFLLDRYDGIGKFAEAFKGMGVVKTPFYY